MKNIDEIALRVWYAQNECMPAEGMVKLKAFAHALLAELSKQEPVAFVQSDPDGHLMLVEITKTEEAQQLDQWDKQMGWKAVPLFTHPLPTAECRDAVHGSIQLARADLEAKVTEQAAEIERLQREVVNRNQRALNGDKSVTAADNLYEQLTQAQAEIESLRKDAELWQAYKKRKDEVIAAGMGRKILRDEAAPKEK